MPASGRRAARRTVMKGALAAGLSAPALSAFLTACGTKQASSTAVKIPSPSNPVTWPLSEANPAIAAGQTPKAGTHAAHLQLRRLPLAAGDEGLRGEVRRRHPALDLQRRRRGADEGRLQGAQVRPLLPELRLAGQAGPGGPAAPAHARLPHQLRQPLAELPRSLVRPRRPLHRALHHVLDRDRLADRHGPHRHRRDGQPVRRALGHDVRRQQCDPRRLAHRDVDGAAAQRDRRHQHHVVQGPRS